MEDSNVNLSYSDLDRKEDALRQELEHLNERKMNFENDIRRTIDALEYPDGGLEESQRHELGEKIERIKAAIRDENLDERLQSIRSRLERIRHARERKQNFKDHPSISRDRINFESESEGEEAHLSKKAQRRATADESDDQSETHVSHPNVAHNRSFEINRRYKFIEHPNIKIDRVKKYGSYAKKISLPIFVAKKRITSTKTDKKHSTMSEKIQRRTLARRLSTLSDSCKKVASMSSCKDKSEKRGSLHSILGPCHHKRDSEVHFATPKVDSEKNFENSEKSFENSEKSFGGSEYRRNFGPSNTTLQAMMANVHYNQAAYRDNSNVGPMRAFSEESRRPYTDHSTMSLKSCLKCGTLPKSMSKMGFSSNQSCSTMQSCQTEGSCDRCLGPEHVLSKISFSGESVGKQEKPSENSSVLASSCHSADICEKCEAARNNSNASPKSRVHLAVPSSEACTTCCSNKYSVVKRVQSRTSLLPHPSDGNTSRFCNECGSSMERSQLSVKSQSSLSLSNETAISRVFIGDSTKETGEESMQYERAQYHHEGPSGESSVHECRSMDQCSECAAAMQTHFQSAPHMGYQAAPDHHPFYRPSVTSMNSSAHECQSIDRCSQCAAEYYSRNQLQPMHYRPSTATLDSSVHECRSIDRCSECAAMASMENSIQQRFRPAVSSIGSSTHECQSMDRCLECEAAARPHYRPSSSMASMENSMQQRFRPAESSVGSSTHECQSMDRCLECEAEARAHYRPSSSYTDNSLRVNPPSMRPFFRPSATSSQAHECNSFGQCSECMAARSHYPAPPSMTSIENSTYEARPQYKPSMTSSATTYSHECRSEDRCSECQALTRGEIPSGNLALMYRPSVTTNESSAHECQSADRCTECAVLTHRRFNQPPQSMTSAESSQVDTSARPFYQQSLSTVHECNSADRCEECGAQQQEQASRTSVENSVQESRTHFQPSVTTVETHECRSADVCSECANAKKNSEIEFQKIKHVEAMKGHAHECRCSECGSFVRPQSQGSKSDAVSTVLSRMTYQSGVESESYMAQPVSYITRPKSIASFQTFVSKRMCEKCGVSCVSLLQESKSSAPLCQTCKSAIVCEECTSEVSKSVTNLSEKTVLSEEVQIATRPLSRASSCRLCTSTTVCGECKNTKRPQTKDGESQTQITIAKHSVVESLSSQESILKAGKVTKTFIEKRESSVHKKLKTDINDKNIESGDSFDKASEYEIISLKKAAQEKLRKGVSHKNCMKSVCVPYFYNECKLPCDNAKGVSLRITPQATVKRSNSNVWLISEYPNRDSASSSKKTSVKSSTSGESVKKPEKKLTSLKRIHSNIWLMREAPSGKLSLFSQESGGETPVKRTQSIRSLLTKPSVIETKTSLSRAALRRKSSTQNLERLSTTFSKTSSKYQDGETIVIQDAEVTIRPKSKFQEVTEVTRSKSSRRSLIKSRASQQHLQSSSTESGGALESKGTSKDLLGSQSVRYQRSSSKRIFSPRSKPRTSFPKFRSSKSGVSFPLSNKEHSFTSDSADSFSQSYRPSPRKSQNLKSSSSRMRLIKVNIELHNQTIDKLHKELQEKSGHADPEEIRALEEKLDSEQRMLREALQEAMVEQRNNPDEKWDPIQVNIKENF